MSQAIENEKAYLNAIPKLYEHISDLAEGEGQHPDITTQQSRNHAYEALKGLLIVGLTAFWEAKIREINVDIWHDKDNNPLQIPYWDEILNFIHIRNFYAHGTISIAGRKH